MMMKLAVLLVIVLVAMVSVSRADDPWSNCGTSSDDIVINQLTISPNPPVKGANFTVALEGVVQNQIAGGNIHLSVKYLGIPLYSHDFDMCKDFSAFVKCPIPKAGNFDRTLTVPFPGAIPSGTYTGEIKGTDLGGNEIFCVDFKVNPVSAVAKPKKAIGLDALVVDTQMISEINSLNLGWKAGRNARFEGKTLADVQCLLGTKLGKSPRKDNIPDVVLHLKDIPATFDSRTQWPGLIHPIRDQEQCGSCWAFGATEALSDRFAIASKGSVNVVLSPQDLVSCDTTDYGCEGGYLNNAWTYLEAHGTVSEDDFPYASGSGVAPACSQEKAGAKRYLASNTVHPTTVESIQTLIMTSGPVEAGFTVYQDFFNYKSGVYVHHSHSVAGGHAVKIVGWGSETDGKKTLDYWLVANSWGTTWGMDGFFKILRGKNECGIEEQIYAGTPVLN